MAAAASCRYPAFVTFWMVNRQPLLAKGSTPLVNVATPTVVVDVGVDVVLRDCSREGKFRAGSVDHQTPDTSACGTSVPLERTVTWRRVRVGVCACGCVQR